MIILLDTSTSTCFLTVIDNEKKYEYQWDAGRTLAKGLLSFLKDSLAAAGGSWQSISGIGVMQGPGSFTGLRIGLTVANTLADSLDKPIVSGTGQDWQNKVIKRLDSGENEKLVMPFYGSEAHITQPKK